MRGLRIQVPTFFKYAPWLGYSMIYAYWREKPHGNTEQIVEVYEAALRKYLKSDRMPFILGEAQYEGSGNIYPNDMGSALHIRRQAYWTMLCGGAGHAYGHDGWFFPANWKQIMQYESARHMGYLIKFFESIPWWQFYPDYLHELLLQGYGQYTKADYVTAATTTDHSIFVAYVPKPAALTLDVSKLEGPKLRARWYNPRTGEYTKEYLTNQGVRKFYSPLQKDWLLILETQP